MRRSPAGNDEQDDSEHHEIDAQRSPLWNHSAWVCGAPGPSALKLRSHEQFLDEVALRLDGARPVDPAQASRAVFQVLNHHIGPDQVANVRERCRRRCACSGRRRFCGWRSLRGDL